MFLRITFVKKVLLTMTSVFYSMIRVMIICDKLTSIYTFLGNQSCYKTATCYQKKDVPTLFQLFLEKLDQRLSRDGTEFVPVLAVACCDLSQESPGIVLTFISRV